jgi:hypothetical protein
MKLDTKIIAGLPVKTARDLMRHLNVSRIDAEKVLEFLNDEHWRSTVDAARKANRPDNSRAVSLLKNLRPNA